MPEILLNFQNLWPKFGYLGLAGIMIIPYLAATMLPFFSIAALGFNLSTQRKFYTLTTKQLVRLSHWLNWYFAFSCLSVYFMLFMPRPELEPYAILLVLIAACVLLTCGLGVIALAGWDKLRHSLATLMSLLLLNGLILQTVLGLSLALGYLHFLGLNLPTSSGSLIELSTWQAFYPELLRCLNQIPLWNWNNLAPCLLLLALEIALAGGIGLIWLLLRRTYDDFGRDYYGNAARFLSSGAACGSWLLLIALGRLTSQVFSLESEIAQMGNKLNNTQLGNTQLNNPQLGNTPIGAEQIANAPGDSTQMGNTLIDSTTQIAASANSDQILILSLVMMLVLVITAGFYTILARNSHPMRFKLSIIIMPGIIMYGLAVGAMILII